MPFFYTDNELVASLGLIIAKTSSELSDVRTVNGMSGDVFIGKNEVGLSNVTNDAQLKRAGGDFNTFTNKSNPIANDIILIEDSANFNTKAKATLTSLPISTATQTALDLKGSVANVSITSNNGITSSIINSSTTPTITLGLENIAPTSVNSTGSITGLNLSGTNTGDETKSSIETKLGVSIVNVINTEGDLSTQVPTAEAILNQFNPAILNLEQQINLKEDKANKGIANGYAGLDATGKVPSTQLPSIASSIATLSDVALNLLNNNEVLIYNSVTTKWENKAIQDVAGGEVVPIGTIQAFYSNTIPVGYLLCDGSTFNATEYSDLNTFLGTNTLPDLRGYFLRGLGGVDPDAGTRTLGSIQQDEFKSHQHELPVDVFGSQDIQSLVLSGGNDEGFPVEPTQKVYTSIVGGAETRPKNIAINYIIKARHNPTSAYNLIAGTDISIATNELNKTITISSTGYTNAQIDTALNLKANQSTTYTKAEVDNLINMQNLINYSFF